MKKIALRLFAVLSIFVIFACSPPDTPQPDPETPPSVPETPPSAPDIDPESFDLGIISESQDLVISEYSLYPSGSEHFLAFRAEETPNPVPSDEKYYVDITLESPSGESFEFTLIDGNETMIAESAGEGTIASASIEWDGTADNDDSRNFVIHITDPDTGTTASEIPYVLNISFYSNYTVSVSAAGPAEDPFTSKFRAVYSPIADTYDHGEMITLDIPSPLPPDYEFGGWTGSVESSELPLTVEVTADLVITAVYNWTGPVEATPNDDISTATSLGDINQGTQKTVSGNISPFGDVDWYKFRFVDLFDIYIEELCTVMARHSDPDLGGISYPEPFSNSGLTIELFSANGTKINWKSKEDASIREYLAMYDGWSLISWKSWMNTNDTKYFYLKVSGNGVGTSKPYSLTIRDE